MKISGQVKPNLSKKDKNNPTLKEFLKKWLITIYCISIYDELDNIKNINCIPVGLGNNISHEEWLTDNTL